jgi:hypothetical protein
MVILVVPSEEVAAEGPGILDAAKAFGELRLLGWTAPRHLVPQLGCHKPTKDRPHEV